MRLAYKHMAFLSVIFTLLSLNVFARLLYPEFEGMDIIAFIVNVTVVMVSKDLIYK